MRHNPDLKCTIIVEQNGSLIDSPNGFYDSFNDIIEYCENLYRGKVTIKVSQANGYYKEKTIKI